MQHATEERCHGQSLHRHTLACSRQGRQPAALGVQQSATVLRDRTKQKAVT